MVRLGVGVEGVDVDSASRARGSKNQLVAVMGLAALLVLPAVADLVIEVTRETDRTLQLTLEVDEAIDVGEGQRLLFPTAVRLCDGLAPSFGTYEFKTREAVGGEGAEESFVLVQDFECGGKERAEDKPPSRELGALERSEMERVARARTVAYHEALAAGDDRTAVGMLPGLSPSATPAEEWRREQAEFRARAGALGEVDVWKVTVYVDPPSAPERGIYVATDLEVQYENLIVCGYFIWLEEPDGVLRITRRDTGTIAANVVSKMSDSQLAKVKSKFRCRPEPEPG